MLSAALLGQRSISRHTARRRSTRGLDRASSPRDASRPREGPLSMRSWCSADPRSGPLIGRALLAHRVRALPDPAFDLQAELAVGALGDHGLVEGLDRIAVEIEFKRAPYRIDRRGAH